MEIGVKKERRECEKERDTVTTTSEQSKSLKRL